MSGSLSSEDRRRLETLFDRAADLPPEQHEAFVRRECGSNEALREELVRLLAGLMVEDVLAAIPPTLASRVGTRIGTYTLLEKVGEGGMGEIYAAEQSAPLARRVAVKIIKAGMDSAQLIARFEAERQALARMSHANIAQVFDGGTTESGSPYFVMEYVAGEPITEYCDRRKLSTRARVALFLDVCDGVQHAHQKGIIHRDLKPSNLLVMQLDDHAVPKIIDFGVARATTGRLGQHTLHTMLGQIVGTLDYMSPEQADPTAVDIDTRSDIYSLGVVLYQLISGLLPFEHQLSIDVPLSEVQRIIREKDPPTPSTRLRRKTGTATALAPLHGTDERSLLRQLSGDLDWICMKALEKDPSRRYPSASELAADLRRHLEFQPVVAGRPGTLYRARKFVRRNRVGVTAGALVTAGVLVGIYGYVAGRLDVAAARVQAMLPRGALRLQELEADADRLWPVHPDTIPAMEEWQVAARALVKTLEESLPPLALEERPGTSELDPRKHDPSGKSVDSAAKLRGSIERMRTGLLAENGISEDHGWSVPKRLAFARMLEQGFAEGGVYDRKWQEALPKIRAAKARLRPQDEAVEVYKDIEFTARVRMGLVPLRPDPDSGLWEFAHLMTGEPAVRGEDGKLIVSGDMGVVLVLVPGGSFTMGAQWKDPQGENYDPYSEKAQSGNEEWPLTREELAPFFISKYEMTQGQWERITGVDPSLELGSDKPVTMVEWVESTRTMSRLRLVLPSEEQWEYAARAGTTTPWSNGENENSPQGSVKADEDLNSLQGYANVYDKTTDAAFPNTGILDSLIEDGWATIAPVGQFKPNRWGLYDVHGNIAEWCSNEHSYDGNPKQSPADRGFAVFRGGSNRQGVLEARSAWRWNFPIGTKFPVLGLRPARALATE